MNQSSEIKNYYNDLASNYDNNRFGNSYGKYIDFQERTVLKTIFSKNTFKETLDLGCGTGRLLDFATHGVDFSEEMLKVAETKHKNVTLKLGEINNIPFNNNFFDCIFCFHVIMHQNKDSFEKFLSEAHQKLNKNGILIFDYISNSRRAQKSEQNSWHANNSFSETEIQSLTHNDWKIKEKYGILLFPIPRFSTSIRKIILPIDTFLCKTFLKKWASYTILVLEKK